MHIMKLLTHSNFQYNHLKTHGILQSIVFALNAVYYMIYCINTIHYTTIYNLGLSIVKTEPLKNNVCIYEVYHKHKTSSKNSNLGSLWLGECTDVDATLSLTLPPIQVLQIHC